LNPSPKSVAKLALIAGVALSMAACASRPKPQPLATPAPSAPAPAAPEPQMPSAPSVGEQQTGPIPGSVQDFVTHAGDRLYFAYDAYVIPPEAGAVLDLEAEWLRRYSQVKMRIEGNADERGTREYNFALGARRANAVKDYLVGKGVQGGRIDTVSYGKERPIDSGTGEDAYAHNRNAHTALVSGAQ
jgi:peptidoglycan-associated lipoprotein